MEETMTDEQIMAIVILTQGVLLIIISIRGLYLSRKLRDLEAEVYGWKYQAEALYASRGSGPDQRVLGSKFPRKDH
jgi:hypothetical protein